MEWDKFRMAQRFLQRANAIHPEEVDDEAARTDAMALQDLYYDCYMSSFSGEALAQRLAQVIEGDIQIPEEQDLDEERYRSIYVQEARKVLGSIERGDFK